MRKLMLAAAFALPMVGGTAMAQETLKIGYIDPLSGGGASVGEVGLKTFQFIADELNAKGGILGKKVEIVPFDNKTNPQESLIQAQKAIDAGVRYSPRATARRSPARCRISSTSTTSAIPARKSSTSTMPRSIRSSPTTSAASGTSAGTPIRHQDGSAHQLHEGRCRTSRRST